MPPGASPFPPGAYRAGVCPRIVACTGWSSVCVSGPLDSRIVGENDSAHCGAVERSVSRDRVRSEHFADFLEGRFAGLDDRTSDDVRVDHRDAQIREHVRHG